MAEINTTQMRDALAWATGERQDTKDASTNPFVWFWEAIEGDFNENRSTAQLLVDAGISMIPLVDQVCDIRDLVANCKKLSADWADKWAWVSLILTLIGLFPTLGSLVKGALKIFFGFVRRSGGYHIAVAVNDAMTWLITWLRRREVQKYIQAKRIDQIFTFLAIQIRAVGARVSVSALKGAFDRGISLLDRMVSEVSYVPYVGNRAKEVLELVKKVRLKADDHLAGALKPVQDLIDAIVLRLEREALHQFPAHVNVPNIHYRGPIPEAAAVAMMAKAPHPAWLSQKGAPYFAPARVKKYRPLVDRLSAKTIGNIRRNKQDIYPALSDTSIKSFHTLKPIQLKGPARLYRVLAPNSRAMSDCWVSEEIFHKLKAHETPKTAWRKFLAVWPDWNVDGQYVVYTLKEGEYLNVWQGTASSQKKASLPGLHLEGGYEQIVFNVERKDTRNDSILFYPNTPGVPLNSAPPITQAQINAMPEPQRSQIYATHIGIRGNINHPNITGPFATGWTYTEFDGAGTAGKIGLPNLPGQASRN
jgi:hypothetical protein